MRWCTLPFSSVIHFLPRQCLHFDIIPHSVQPSSLRPSSLPSPLYFHSRHSPSYVVPSLRITCPYHRNLFSWIFVKISFTFVVEEILFFQISYPVELCNFAHSSLYSHYCDFNLFPCAFFTGHLSAPVPVLPLSCTPLHSSSCSFVCHITLPSIHLHFGRSFLPFPGTSITITLAHMFFSSHYHRGCTIVCKAHF